MNTNRKRDVEELLRGGSVPPPPADLLDRIKNEIPAELPRSAAPRPSRPSRIYWMPIAASLLLAIGVGVMMLVMNPKAERQSPVAATAERATPAAPSQKMAESRVAEVAPPPPPPLKTAPSLQQKLEPAPQTTDALANDVRVQQPVAIAKAAEDDEYRTATREQPYLPPRGAPARPEESSIAMQDRAAEGVTAEASADEAQATTGAIASVAPAPPSAPMAAAAPPVAQSGRGQTESRKLAEPRRNRDTGVRFQFARGTSSYEATRTKLGADRLPSARSIDSSQFLSNFTYGDERPSSGPFAISTELVSLHAGRGETTATLRIAVTARGATAREAESNPVLARGLSCEVIFDDGVVSHELIAAAADDHGARTLGDVTTGYNGSALFNVVFRTGAPERIATVTLHWIDPDGTARSRAVDVETADIRSWDSASAGFKLSQVAVSLAETLRGEPMEPRSMLMRHAELLPTWFPRDAAVSELVTLVRKATRLLDGE